MLHASGEHEWVSLASLQKRKAEKSLFELIGAAADAELPQTYEPEGGAGEAEEATPRKSGKLVARPAKRGGGGGGRSLASSADASARTDAGQQQRGSGGSSAERTKDPAFWKAVSSKLGTGKTALQCSQQYSRAKKRKAAEAELAANKDDASKWEGDWSD